MKIIYVLCLLLCMVNVSFASTLKNSYVIDEPEMLSYEDKEYVKQLSGELEHYTNSKIKLIMKKYLPDGYNAEEYADEIWKNEVGKDNILVFASMHEQKVLICCTDDKFSKNSRTKIINDCAEVYMKREDIPTAVKNTVQEIANELIERHLKDSNKMLRWWW